MANLRINIIGASGAGKTTLAMKLSEKLNIPHFDLDHYFHIPTDPPFQKQRPANERKTMLMSDLKGLSSWALSGAVFGWEPQPALSYTLVILLYLDPKLRLERLRKREFDRFGKRVMPGGDMEKEHKSFMNWTSGYDSGGSEGNNTLPNHLKFIKSVSCQTMQIDGDKPTDEQVDLIISNFNSLK